ncbi:TolC family protein [Pyxidicoccus fallax]|uniref:TolC family protein n=1 Tax=Pyxidicoccus fallax TaxID=394095 RepID=A0A848LPI7_9BACT|nr:TolC family protein [Pyxidicoccus fallax]NMO19666.1 TolC family protein [Pyxidicoccus fallax]NPC83925.1 TolC family protein [Pyxidicoccus fallax]
MNALLLAVLLSRSSPVPGLLLAQAGTGAVQQPTPGAPTSTPTPRPAPGTPPSSATPPGAAGGTPPRPTPGTAPGPDEPTPPQPEVSDPLLAPVPPAPVQVSSWEEALNLLKQRSTDLRTALARVETAAGLRRIALAGLLPTITGNVSAQYNVLNPDAVFIGGGTGGIGGGIGGGTGGGDGEALRPTNPPVVGTLTATQPLFNLQAITALGTAREAERTASLSLAETRRQLTGALAQGLVGVSARERLAEVSRVNLRSALERLALAQRRLELGAGTRLDVVRVQQDAESTRVLVVTNDEQLRQARESLGLALGTPGAVGLARGVDLEALLRQARRDCHRLEDLNSRPDLAAARSRLVVAERQVTEVKTTYVPTLALTSNVLALTVEDGVAEVPVWNVGAALVLPFYEGGAREGRLRQTRAEAEVARQDVVELERNVTVEVAQARRGVEVATAARDIAARERDLAEENDRLTRRSFEVGTGTSLELIQTAATLRQAELQLVVREFELEQARVEAFLAEASCEW